MPQLVFQGLDGTLLGANDETELQGKPETGHKYHLRNLNNFLHDLKIAEYSVCKGTGLLVI